MLSLTFGRFFSIAAWRVSIGLSWKDVESLTCGCNFDQSLEDVTFPSSLKSIIFGAHFDQSLKHVRFASDIRSLTFGANFNQSLEFSLPSRLESLVFGELFKQSLKTSTFGEAFDQSLKEIDWPSNLQTLAFGFCFDQSLKDVTWLAVSECFRSYFISLWLIVYVRWCPDSTKGDFARQSLKFDLWRSVFNQSMEAVILPEIGCLIGFTTLGKIRMKHYHHGNSCPQGRTLTSLWRHHVHLPPSLRTVCCQSCRCRLWQKAVSEKMRSWPGQMLYPQRCHQTWMAGKIMKFLDDFQGFSDSNMLKPPEIVREPPRNSSMIFPANETSIEFSSQQYLIPRGYVDPHPFGRAVMSGLSWRTPTVCRWSECILPIA